MGRHGRPEADPLDGVDVAADLEPGPVVEISPQPGPPVAPAAEAVREHRHGHRRSRAPATTEAPMTADPLVTAGQPASAPVRVNAIAGTTIIAHRDRRSIREARRAANRRRLLIVSAGVLALLLIVGVTAVVLSGRGSGVPVAAPPRTPHQSTLLVQVSGQDGTAVVNALVGVTPATGNSAALLIPAGLLVDDASSGNLPFGETLTLPSKHASVDALTDLLGLRVSDSWVLSQPGLAALVDKVGGVQVTVDVDVISKNAKGDQTVVVRAGSQRLSGAQAAAYATYLADGEPEAVRLARFNDVLDGALRSLPATPAAIATTLTGLSTGSTSSLRPQQLAGLLALLRTAASKQSLHYDVLPVNDFDTGGTVATYGLNSAKASALLQSLFAPSLLKDRTGDTVRVLVENGIGTPDLVTAARVKLVRDGFQFVTGGNASVFSAKDPSVVLIGDGSDRNQARGARVAKSLGLPSSSIEINPRGQTVADIIVILGADFRP